MTDKAPGKYLSKQTNNPIKNNCYYFTCPISDEFGYGAKAGIQMYKADQEWKKHFRLARDFAVNKKLITAEEGETKMNECLNAYECFKDQEINKPLYNPAYTEWVKQQPSTQEKRKKNREDKTEHIINLEKQNDKNKQYIKNLEDINKELGFVNQTLNDENKQLKKQLKELQEQLNKQKEPEPKKTNKGKKYNTKNKQVDTVLDEIIDAVVEEPIDL